MARCGDFVVREFVGGADIEQRAAAQRDSFTGNPEADNISAVKLYESNGFKVVDKLFSYIKQIG